MHVEFWIKDWSEEEKEAYRKSHPKPTGFGWYRKSLTGEGEPVWIPMDKDELHVYRVVKKSLPSEMEKKRM
ncbi:MAG: hypothetical protein Q6362_003835 [Candidatus Wukongarchaeota archaeon]|nr:hypothetical protein [Candidatus Wukongarchaeota archaeon]MDO8128559.1 hypothetical protein [Candidatus Wukongarchaeota archaeon]